MFGKAGIFEINTSYGKQKAGRKGLTSGWTWKSMQKVDASG